MRISSYYLMKDMWLNLLSSSKSLKLTFSTESRPPKYIHSLSCSPSKLCLDSEKSLPVHIPQHFSSAAVYQQWLSSWDSSTRGRNCNWCCSVLRNRLCTETKSEPEYLHRKKLIMPAVTQWCACVWMTLSAVSTLFIFSDLLGRDKPWVFEAGLLTWWETMML